PAGRGDSPHRQGLKNRGVWIEHAVVAAHPDAQDREGRGAQRKLARLIRRLHERKAEVREPAPERLSGHLEETRHDPAAGAEVLLPDERVVVVEVRPHAQLPLLFAWIVAGVLGDERGATLRGAFVVL